MTTKRKRRPAPRNKILSLLLLSALATPVAAAPAHVARRFGISVSALLYMNQGLQVIDDEQHLFAGTTLVLDPDSI